MMHRRKIKVIYWANNKKLPRGKLYYVCSESYRASMNVSSCFPSSHTKKLTTEINLKPPEKQPDPLDSLEEQSDSIQMQRGLNSETDTGGEEAALGAREKETFRGGEERRGKESVGGSLSDVNYPSPSCSASENKCKHGEKKGHNNPFKLKNKSNWKRLAANQCSVVEAAKQV